MNVKRQDLIQQLVETHHYTKKAATALVDDFTALILENMRVGNTISLRNFGSIDYVVRAPRKCPNPKTGETYDIPEHIVPKFHPAPKMRAVVKMWEDDKKRGLR